MTQQIILQATGLASTLTSLGSVELGIISSSYLLRLLFLGSAVIVAGVVGFALLTRKYESTTLGGRRGRTFVSHGVTWTPTMFAMVFAIILIVTLAIGTVVYLPHP